LGLNDAVLIKEQGDGKMVPQADGELSPWQEFQQQIQAELEKAKNALRETSLMFDQSQSELSRLTQRNTSIAAHLQQVRTQLESMSKADIQTAYASALDSQQRLLLMRGQLERLQKEKEVWQQYVDILEKANSFFADNQQAKAGRSGGSTIEMLVNAQEAERQRLSRQMHDGPVQALSNFIVQAEIAAHVFDQSPEAAKEELNKLKNSAMSTFQKVRMFIAELRPMMLDDLGLLPTARRYVDTFKEQMGVDVMLTVKGTDRRLEPYEEVMVFRALQELMGNAVRHNQDAPSKLQLTVQILLDEKTLRVIVSDNGKGFDPKTAAERGGLGLKLIRDRVEMMGGFMEVESSIGQGSRVSFQIPVTTVGEVDGAGVSVN